MPKFKPGDIIITKFNTYGVIVEVNKQFYRIKFAHEQTDYLYSISSINLASRIMTENDKVRLL